MPYSSGCPQDNIVHRFNPIAKLLVLVFIIVLLLMDTNFYIYPGVFFFLLAIALLGRISPAGLFRKVRPLCYFLVMIAAVHLFFTPGRSIPPFPVWKINITLEGAKNGGMVFLRFFLLITASSILTMTTPPMKLAKGLETVFFPFGLIGFPISRFSKMVVLTLQFIPVVFFEVENAFKKVALDVPDFSSLSVFRKIPYLALVVDHVFRRSLLYADELAAGNEEDNNTDKKIEN
ncbi:MAG: energy-coupling factor transporter transmembrane protein EcfT [Nitrospinae bacterium]|nr:energy-coupling factor transporter transmembrane protein EcfT [Nitrospinota bacterium]